MNIMSAHMLNDTESVKEVIVERGRENEFVVGSENAVDKDIAVDIHDAKYF